MLVADAACASASAFTPSPDGRHLSTLTPLRLNVAKLLNAPAAEIWRHVGQSWLAVSGIGCEVIRETGQQFAHRCGARRRYGRSAQNKAAQRLSLETGVAIRSQNFRRGELGTGNHLWSPSRKPP